MDNSLDAHLKGKHARQENLNASEYLELVQCSVLKIPFTVMYFGKFAFDCGELLACLSHGGSELHTDELAWMH